MAWMRSDVRPSEADLEAIRLCEWGYLIVTAHEVAVYENTGFKWAADFA